MEVFASNFPEAISLLKTIIDEEEILFAGLDCEFSGLRLNPSRRLGALDKPQTRYENMKEVANSFALLQVGICLFYESDSKLKCFPLTLNVFPQNTMKTCENRFLFEPGSMKFLRSNGFDFNKLIDDGIPMLPEEDEKVHSDAVKRKRNRQAERQATKSRANPGIRDRAFMEDLKGRLATFLVSTQKEMELDDVTSGFRRLLVYQMLEYDFPTLVASKSKKADDRPTMLISRTELTRKQMDLQQEKQRDQELADMLQKHRGVRDVFKLLREKEITLVGHNCCLDLGYIYRNCIGLLPEKIDDWQKNFTDLFDSIFDLKYFISAHPRVSKVFSSTNLGDVRDAMKREKFIVPFLDFELHETAQRYEQGGMEHEAGYDAMLAGQIFASVASYVSGVSIADVDLAKSFPNICNRVNQPRLTYACLSMTSEHANDWEKHFRCVIGDSTQFVAFDDISKALHSNKIRGRFEFRSQRIKKINPDTSEKTLVNEIFIWEKDTSALGDLVNLLNKIQAVKDFPLQNLRLYFDGEEKFTSQPQKRVCDADSEPPRKRQKTGEESTANPPETTGKDENQNIPVISPATGLSNLVLEETVQAAGSEPIPMEVVSPGRSKFPGPFG